MTGSVPPESPPPRVLIVMPAQWPRALLRAALREAGYDAAGTRDLGGITLHGSDPGRGPLRLVIVDAGALGAAGGDAPLLEARRAGVATLLIAPAAPADTPGPWNHVLHRPASIGEIVGEVETMLPLPPEARKPVD